MRKSRRKQFGVLRATMICAGTKYSGLSRNLKALICNGCGPKGGWMPIPEFTFTASCNHHDYKYFIGGTKADRKKADKQFYQAMKKDADCSKWFQRWRYRMWAFAYYGAVRAWGWTCFWYDGETE